MESNEIVGKQGGKQTIMNFAPKLPLSEIFLDGGTMQDYGAAKILHKVNSTSRHFTQRCKKCKEVAQMNI